MSDPTIRIFPPGAPPAAASNRFAALIPSQSIAVVSSFTLESGVTLEQVPVGFRTWGKLNAEKDNVMILCHALTGSSDVEDWYGIRCHIFPRRSPLVRWAPLKPSTNVTCDGDSLYRWGPLLGPNLAFDPTRYFIFCANVLGSPYGTASPTTKNPHRDDGGRWGPEFPATVVRDDVRLQKLLLDHLGVARVSVVIGGSMGGMQCLEWPLCTPPGYVSNICPVATSARHSAWGISWGEAQRQSIYSDPDYQAGWYAEDGEGPERGLAAARMAALLTYRSRDSFESRFGRKENPSTPREGSPKIDGASGLGRGKITDAWGTPRTQAERAEAAHNDGHRPAVATRPASPTLRSPSTMGPRTKGGDLPLTESGEPLPPPSPPPIFSAQSYLRYQGDKFVRRFDANCYIHLTRKMDAHDVGRGRPSNPPPLSLAPPGALVIAISTDGLFTLSEQRELASALPEADLIVVDSPDGHDGFLLEFEQINSHISRFLKLRLPEIYEREPIAPVDKTEGANGSSGFQVQHTSLFGEAEAGDITRW